MWHMEGGLKREGRTFLIEYFQKLARISYPSVNMATQHIHTAHVLLDAPC